MVHHRADPAIHKLLDKVGWSTSDVDLFEINEAFAVVRCGTARSRIPRDKLNINGGACALGHPIGATGARLIVTLLHALEAQNLRRGVAHSASAAVKQPPSPSSASFINAGRRARASAAFAAKNCSPGIALSQLDSGQDLARPSFH